MKNVLWPVPDWQVDTAAAAKFNNYQVWLERQIKSEPFGTVIVVGGKIVFEQYGGGGTAGSRWEIGSIRKSVANTLLGKTVEEGKLALDTRVYDVWPPLFTLTKQEKDKEIRLYQLASATSGWKTPALPGQEWRYNNLAFTAFHAVIGRVYGLPGDKIAPLVESRLRDKIGANWRVYHYDADWNTNPGPKLAVDSNLRDLAKYGYLWLRRGEWNGAPIVPAAHVAESSRNQAARQGRHYGYLWFTNDNQTLLPAAPPDAYYHTGSGRENRRTVLLICPSLDLVAALGHHKNAYDLTPERADALGGAAAAGINHWINQIVTPLKAVSR